MNLTIVQTSNGMPHLLFTLLAALAVATIAALPGRRTLRDRVLHAGYLVITCLGAATSRIMRDLLVSAAAHGVTVFLTSHILPVVERIADRIVMIRGGNIVWNSAASELPESLEDLYLKLAEPPASEALDWLSCPEF